MWSEKGKNTIVTGAGSGIGKALALQLARRGAHVAVTDIQEDRLEPVKQELLSLGVRAEAYKVDHADEQAVSEFYEQYTAQWGRADIMCLNAGVAAVGAIQDLTLDDWKWNLGVNLWGPIFMVNKFIPSMIKAGSGGILFTVSVAGFSAPPGVAPYATSKHGLIGFAESLKAEMKQYNIHVCALCPGFVNTNIACGARVNIDESRKPEKLDKWKKFYVSFGANPERVAKDGLKGLAKNRLIQPSTYHAWLAYYSKRFIPRVTGAISSLAWKKGWVV